MRIIFTIILLIQSINVISQSNNNKQKLSIICTYNLIYRQDSTNNTSKQDLMTLTIAPNKSKFESKNSYLYDSTLASPSFDQSSLNMLANYATPFTYKIYKSREKYDIKYYDRIGQKKFNIKQINTPITWNILPDKKVLAGFSCQKATAIYAGRRWEAWFTKEIPISEGPYKFSGLPGLIVEISDTTNSYIFTLTSIKNISSNLELELPNNSIETSFEQYIKAKSEYFYNGVSQITKRNSPDNYNKEMEEYKQKQARKNNPIELKY